MGVMCSCLVWMVRHGLGLFCFQCKSHNAALFGAFDGQARFVKDMHCKGVWKWAATGLLLVSY